MRAMRVTPLRSPRYWVSALQHVDEHEFCAVGLGFFLNSLQPAQNLASEGAAEVAEKYDGE